MSEAIRLQKQIAMGKNTSGQHLAKGGRVSSDADCAGSDLRSPMGNRGHASGGLIKPSHKGRLHRALGVPEGQKIPAAKIAKAANSKNPHMAAMGRFAQNFGKK